MNNRPYNAYKVPKLPRKLKKAIKSFSIENYKTKIHDVNYYKIRVDFKIGFSYKGKKTKYKMKAVSLLRNSYIKSQRMYYNRMKKDFNLYIF